MKDNERTLGLRNACEHTTESVMTHNCDNHANHFHKDNRKKCSLTTLILRVECISRTQVL